MQLIIGLFVGGMVGVITMAIMAAGKDDDD